MRQLFLFTNTKGNGRTGWEDCYSMADDGKVLGNHVCSSMGFIRHDLVGRDDRTEDIEKHFNCKLSEIEIIILKPGKLPPAEIIEKNTARRIAEDVTMKIFDEAKKTINKEQDE